MSFGHAGTIVEGKEDTATEKIARLEAAGIRGRRADRRDPRRGQGEARGRRLMAEATEQGLHRRRGRRLDRERRRARGQARGSLPGRHLQGRRRRRRDRRGEPRRVRPLQALHRSGARRHRARQEALRRHRASAHFVGRGFEPEQHAREQRRRVSGVVALDHLGAKSVRPSTTLGAPTPTARRLRGLRLALGTSECQ